MNSEFRNIIRTNHRDYTLFVLRIAVGTIVLPHCIQEIIQFTAMDYYAGENPTIIFIVNFTLVILELLFTLLLVSGFAVRISAICSMAVLFFHLSFGSSLFFESLPFGVAFLSFGNYKILVLFVAVSFVLAKRGSGPLSIDAFLVTRSNQNQSLLKRI